MRQLDAWDNFFTSLYDACEEMDIPADTTISEAGPGQFEINLMHSPDALRAADDAWLFKLMARGMARSHGFAASFMAKPYPEYSGNGLHAHFSILDAEGRNIFDDGTAKGSDVLRHAIAGCLKAMSGSMLILAPHASSYDRFVPGAHAPTGIAWAYENRTTALRVPAGGGAARRIEHRVAGGDINPYLLIAAILGAALNGIEDGDLPPEPITGNAYSHDLEQLPTTWQAAIDAFEQSPEIARIFAPELIANFLATKRQELHYMAELSPQEQTDLYLDTV
jgi:glutamine synthetase